MFDACPRKYAFGHDEVAPLSRQPLDPRNGWGATIVDAMSTMVCKSRYLPYVFELNNGFSTSWDSQYDNCSSPFPLAVPDRRLKFRISLMKHSTLHIALTSRNRTPTILLGTSFLVQTVSFVLMTFAASLRAPSVTLQDSSAHTNSAGSSTTFSLRNQSSLLIACPSRGLT